MFRQTLVAAAMAAAFPLAHAQSVELPPVVVTSKPLGSGLLDLVTPVSTLSQADISRSGASTLGEALKDMPGISASNFGPNASRPVIRGLDADRIRLLANGTGVSDLSALSPDHAVPVDPFVIDQIEVVRGPAALIHGGSAVGGVVNALDNRIPQESIRGTQGRAEVRAGGADSQRGGGAVMEGGSGSLALHLDAFKRDTDDLRIPGYARSARLRAIDPQPIEARDRLPDSSSQSNGGAIGGAWTFHDGYAGISYSGYNSNYGVVAEEGVRIDMQSERVDMAGEVRELDGFFTKLKARVAHTDYRHQELDAGTVATMFRNQGHEALLEARHRKIGELAGVFGLTTAYNDIEAIGEEALLPRIAQRARAAYLYEELPLAGIRLSFGARIARADVDSDGGGPIDPNTGNPRFGDASEVDFTPKSAALGALLPLAPAWSLAGNVSHSQRAPSYNELFANGPHAATGQYEIGNHALDIERSKGVDLQLRWKEQDRSASIGVFRTRFSNYINLFATGKRRDEDGLINPAGEFAEAEVHAVPAVLQGLEAEGRLRIDEGLDLRLKGDLLRAENRDTGEPLPRIAPWRIGAGLDYRLHDFSARIDALYAAKQERVAAKELPTDSYVQLDLLLGYTLRSDCGDGEIFLKAGNLLDEEIRLHTSTLKDIAPLGGRSLQLGLRGTF